MSIVNPEIAVNLRMAVVNKLAGHADFDLVKIKEYYDWVVEPLARANILPVASFKEAKA